MADAVAGGGGRWAGGREGRRAARAAADGVRRWWGGVAARAAQGGRSRTTKETHRPVQSNEAASHVRRVCRPKRGVGASHVAPRVRVTLLALGSMPCRTSSLATGVHTQRGRPDIARARAHKGGPNNAGTA